METKRSALEDAIDWFLDHLKMERGASPHTLLAYGNDLGMASQFFSGLGVHSWVDLSNQDLMRFEASLGAPIARTTAQRRMSSLRSLLKFLKRQGKGPTAELPSTAGFKKAKRLPKALSADNLEKVAIAAAVIDSPTDTADPRDLRDRALLELIYGAGLRVSEAVSLERQQLDLDNGVVRVDGKRGKTRLVPLPQGTLAWLRQYLISARPLLATKPTSRVFVNDHAKPYSRQLAYLLVANAAKAAGLEQHVGPHTLRHTYAVHLLKGGADLRAVQELLGHESIATTQVYTQLDLDEVRKKYASAHPRR